MIYESFSQFCPFKRQVYFYLYAWVPCLIVCLCTTLVQLLRLPEANIRCPRIGFRDVCEPSSVYLESKQFFLWATGVLNHWAISPTLEWVYIIVLYFQRIIFLYSLFSLILLEKNISQPSSLFILYKIFFGYEIRCILEVFWHTVFSSLEFFLASYKLIFEHYCSSNFSYYDIWMRILIQSVYN